MKTPHYQIRVKTTKGWTVLRDGEDRPYRLRFAQAYQRVQDLMELGIPRQDIMQIRLAD